MCTRACIKWVVVVVLNADISKRKTHPHKYLSDYTIMIHVSLYSIWELDSAIVSIYFSELSIYYLVTNCRPFRELFLCFLGSTFILNLVNNALFIDCHSHDFLFTSLHISLGGFANVVIFGFYFLFHLYLVNTW